MKSNPSPIGNASGLVPSAVGALIVLAILVWLISAGPTPSAAATAPPAGSQDGAAGPISATLTPAGPERNQLFPPRSDLEVDAATAAGNPAAQSPGADMLGNPTRGSRMLVEPPFLSGNFGNEQSKSGGGLGEPVPAGAPGPGSARSSTVSIDKGSLLGAPPSPSFAGDTGGEAPNAGSMTGTKPLPGERGPESSRTPTASSAG